MDRTFLNDVIRMSLAWGPQRMVPLADRVRERYPDATDADIAAASAVADRLLSRAIEHDAGEGPATTLAEDFPDVDDDNRRDAAWQGRYSNWRDGVPGRE